MYVCYKNMKINKEEWHPATKPLKMGGGDPDDLLLDLPNGVYGGQAVILILPWLFFRNESLPICF